MSIGKFTTFFQCLVIGFSLIGSISNVEAQFIRGNSPYSRYGIGDLQPMSFATGASFAGGLNATYRSYWESNLVNPASLSKLRFTSFDVGVFYRHGELTERSTGLSASTDDGNLSYLSLSFPITRSWEIMKDTLRRGVPIQWGMGFSLTPFSRTSYDVSVRRFVSNIDSVDYRYTGEGNLYRINWANGIGYKGFSLGANLSFVFGRNTYNSTIEFRDSTYGFGFDQNLSEERNTSGLLWDVGAQYELVLRKDGNADTDLKLLLGAYAGGSANLRTVSKELFIRYGETSIVHSSDTIRNTEGVEGNIQLPLKIGGGFSIGKEFGWLVGVNYEQQFWSQFRRNGQPDPNLSNSFNIAVGAQWIPDFTDFTSYFNRIRYRFGFQYGTDPRTLSDASGTASYQLYTYGGSIGLGLPIRPPKSKAILGFINLGVDVGYMGHPELIGDFYVRVNAGFTLSDGSWFVRRKFR